MKKRGYVRITDDSQLDRMESVANELRSHGFEVSDDDVENAKITGQLVGEADEDAFPSIREQVTSFGASFASEDEDMEHRLPDPGSDLQ